MGKAFSLTVEESGIARLRFDLPGEKVNKFTAGAMRELDSLLSADLRDERIKVLGVTSAKRGIFIAGADIAELQRIETVEEGMEKARSGQEVFNKLAELPYPTVAVIDGACLGGGLEMALACTYRVVTDNARSILGAPEVQLGIIPGWGGTQRLPGLIGLPQALTMILGGKPVSGSRAYRMKLADAFVASEFVEEEADRFLRRCLDAGERRKMAARRKLPGIGGFLLNRTSPGRALVFRQARGNAMKRTKGRYPAPLKALEVVEKTFGRPLAEGLVIEAEAFAGLAVTGICRNMIQLFYTGEALKKETGGDPSIEPVPVLAAGVLGAGVMGGGIAWLFSFKDIPVRLKDINWEAVGKGFAQAADYFAQLKKRRKIDSREVNLKMHHLSGTLEYSGFGSLDVIVEAIVENMAVKKTVLAELEKEVRSDALIFSNTSALSITGMGEALEHPERLAGMHFFNPVNRMPLVEIIPGEKTSPQTVVSAVSLTKKLGKTPVVVRDRPGFLINRILIPYMNEAALMLQEGCALESIDRVIEGFGMPMGPFVLADEVGIDIGSEVIKTLESAFAPRIRGAEIFHDLLGLGLSGKKGGKGFYLHRGKKRSLNPAIAGAVAQVQQRLGLAPRSFTDEEIEDRIVLVMLGEAVLCLEEKIVDRPEYLDMAMLMGAGFPPYRGGLLRYAEERGPGDVVKKMNELESEYGERFKPPELLVRKAKKGESFYTRPGPAGPQTGGGADGSK